jgi:hypothetical protein
MLFSQLLTLHHRGDLTLRSILVCVMFMISLAEHLVPTIIGVSLATDLRIHILTFLFKVLHVRPCYLFTLFHFASHRSLPIHSRLGHVGCRILFHIGLKISALWGALWVRTYFTWLLVTICYFLRDWIFFSSGIYWAFIPYCMFFCVFALSTGLLDS